MPIHPHSWYTNLHLMWRYTAHNGTSTSKGSYFMMFIVCSSHFSRLDRWVTSSILKTVAAGSSKFSKHPQDYMVSLTYTSTTMKYSCLSSSTASTHLHQTKIKSQNTKGAPSSKWQFIRKSQNLLKKPKLCHCSHESLPPIHFNLIYIFTTVSLCNITLSRFWGH